MEQEQKLAVKVGSDFVLDLPSNPTTGYKWEPEYDKTLLDLLGTTYKSVLDRMGSGGRQLFRFVARRKGQAVIRMLYKRPWDQKSVREAVYTVAIRD